MTSSSSLTSSRGRRYSVIALGAVVVVLCLVPGAGASIPGPDGVIHGCYGTAPSALSPLSVIDSASLCPAGSNSLNWSQTGPPGPQGPAGPSVAPDALHEGGSITVWVQGDASFEHPRVRGRTIPLPLGTWAVTMHVNLQGTMNCGLYPDIGGATKSYDNMTAQTSIPSTEVTFTAIVNETTGNELKLVCASFANLYNEGAIAEIKSMTAIRVGTVTELPTLSKDDGKLTIDPNHSFPHIPLAAAQHERLVMTYYAQTTPPKARQRAQIALLAAEGHSIGQIADQTFASVARIEAVIRSYHGRIGVAPRQAARNSATRASS